MSPHVKSSLAVTVVAVLLCIGLLICPRSLSAQVIKIEAGASDILPSQGGSINFQGENYEGYVGAGDIGGVFRFGSYLKTSLYGYKFTLGDQSTVIGLPTDIFGAQQYFLARGAGISGQVHGAKVFLFGGATALGVGSQFFQGAQAQVPVGMFFLDIPLSDKLVFYSRNLGSRQQTSIQGLDWHPLKWLRTGLSAGIGGNQPYLATTFDVHRDWLDVKAGYISAGDRFRRITTPSIFAAEPDRENLLVTIKPVSSLVVIAGHQNLLQPQTDLNAPFLRASVDQFQSSYTIAKFRLGAGFFQSHSQSFRNRGEDFSVSRAVTRRIEAGVNYFRSLSGPSPRSSNLSATIRETISPKLSLLQVVTRSQGNTNVLFGGSFTTNRFAVSVDYQTLYLPFLANPFSQGLSVSLRIKLFGNFQVNGQTFRSADGKLRYSAGASTLLVHNFQHGGGEGQVFAMPKYVVRGHVRDQIGAPIEGAALRIGGELVYTNAFGEFLVRQKKAGSLPFEVVLGEFINRLPFRIIAAPSTVTAEPEDSAPDVQIVLAPALRPQSQRPPLPGPLPPPPMSEPASVPTPVTPAPTASGDIAEVSKAPKYVIRGHVRDENGQPIEGVAVPIGNEIVFTNAKGEFLLRQKRAGLFSLAVEFEQSQFKVMAAPKSVAAKPEDSSPDVLVVLARAFPNKQL
jgi:hypothetical protein